MKVISRLGLRARLAIALVAVAVLGVGLATVLSNRGLHPRVSEAAQARLTRSAEHMAEVAAAVYRDEGTWTPEAVETLEHLARLNRISVRVIGAGGEPIDVGHIHTDSAGDVTANAPVALGGREVGSVEVAPLSGELLTPEEEHLQTSLDRLHLVAGAASVLAALIVAFLLAHTLSRPLRRIRYRVQRIEEGDLTTRVQPEGGPEVRAVGQALNRLVETLQHEETVRRATVADLAHELRTPVTGLLSRIEAAQDRVLSDKGGNLVAMHGEALRLSRLLDDLAQLAEAERPGLLLEKRPLDLAEVGQREADIFGPRLAAKGIEFSTQLEPVSVRGDPDRLAQVVANLLSNALRYTERGGSVSLRVLPDGDHALLEVSDTGIGIAPDDLSHVFTRFWRGEKSRSRATGGAGIGLAIVQELVRAHEGRVDVVSTPGRGSTFRVVLSRLPAEPLHENRRGTSSDLHATAGG